MCACARSIIDVYIYAYLFYTHRHRKRLYQGCVMLRDIIVMETLLWTNGCDAVSVTYCQQCSEVFLEGNII